MKTKLIAVLTCFILLGCNATKKVIKTTESKKTSEKTHKSTIDSTSSTIESLPTENKLVFNLDDLNKTVGDFMQEINAGNGNKSKIEKRGRQLIVTSNNAGSKKTETKVKEKDEVVIYNAEYFISEAQTVIKRIPWKYWIWIIILLIIIFRKFIFQLLSAAFPALKGFRFIALILGIK